MSHLLVPGIAFAIASSPATFRLTRKVAGPWVSSFEGVATPAGLFLHTLFFLLILYLVGKVMPRKSGYGNLAGYKFGKGEHETHRASADNIEGMNVEA
jgi:hypothetical protein